MSHHFAKFFSHMHHKTKTTDDQTKTHHIRDKFKSCFKSTGEFFSDCASGGDGADWISLAVVSATMASM